MLVAVPQTDALHFHQIEGRERVDQLTVTSRDNFQSSLDESSGAHAHPTFLNMDDGGGEMLTDKS